MAMMITIANGISHCSVYSITAQCWAALFYNSPTLLGVKNLFFIFWESWNILDFQKTVHMKTVAVCMELAKTQVGTSWPEAHAVQWGDEQLAWLLCLGKH